MKAEKFKGYVFGGILKYYHITPNKIYDFTWEPKMVYSSDGIYYELVDDLGKKIIIHESHVKRLDKERDLKIKDLLE
jgi:hypothetical protein